MRYIIREGEKPRSGRYMSKYGTWIEPPSSGPLARFLASFDVAEFKSRHAAERQAKWHGLLGSRAVRLVSAAESCERARRRGIVDALRWAASENNDTGRSWWGWLHALADNLENGSIAFTSVPAPAQAKAHES